MRQHSDPLGILSTTRRVLEQASFVRLEHAAIVQLAEDFGRQRWSPPPWSRTYHWSDGPNRMANYLLALDALNFSFWGEPRWRVAYHGELLDGYWALAAAMKQALERGVPLDAASYLEHITPDILVTILDGENVLPLLTERAANLREAGRVLRDRYQGRFSLAIEAAGKSAVRLVQLLADDFPSFRDIAVYKGQEVRFYKRAQLLVSDLHGAFGGCGLGEFDDLADLTTFADYKLPQVLAHFGVLVYAPALLERLAARVEIPAGSPEEVEIRAATVWAVEELRRALAARGHRFDAYQIDWMLWDAGQHLPADVLPYHRTRTIYY